MVGVNSAYIFGFRISLHLLHGMLNCCCTVWIQSCRRLHSAQLQLELPSWWPNVDLNSSCTYLPSRPEHSWCSAIFTPRWNSSFPSQGQMRICVMSTKTTWTTTFSTGHRRLHLAGILASQAMPKPCLNMCKQLNLVNAILSYRIWASQPAIWCCWVHCFSLYDKLVFVADEKPKCGHTAMHCSNFFKIL